MESHRESEKQQGKLLDLQAKQQNKITNFLLVVSFLSESVQTSMTIYHQTVNPKEVIERIVPEENRNTEVPARPARPDPRDKPNNTQKGQ